MWLIVRKLRSKLIDIFSVPVLTFLARLKLKQITGLLLRWHIQTWQRGGSKDHELIQILFLPKFGFTEDIFATFGGIPRYGLYALDRRIVKSIFNAYLPIYIDDNFYRTGDAEIEKKKAELRLFWKNVLQIMNKRAKFDAVMTGNFSYASEQELAGALNEMGIPFIALHKECLKTPGLEPFYREIYATRKNPFQGHRICVYNEVEQRIEREARIADPENIILTGMPRLDSVHREREISGHQNTSKSKRPTVLFFLFNIKAGLPIIGRKTGERFETLEEDLERLNVARLSKSCHLAMLELARKNPEIRVVIKTKGDDVSAKTLQNVFGNHPELPENFQIMVGGDTLGILIESSVVCGFNTTALIEAVTLNKAVVMPHFYEAADPSLAKYVLEMKGVAKFATSEEELNEMLRDTALVDAREPVSSDLDPVKKKFLERWVGNPDGRASERVREVVEGVVAEYRDVIQKEGSKKPART
jgi:hypothetical protein